MSDPLDEELDALFRQHPNAMVKERNALADRLRKAGNKEGAAKVKAFARPSSSAWALNQVYFDHRELFDEALARTEEVRVLHARDGVDVRELKQAVAAQRALVTAVVEVATRCIETAGLPSSPAHQRKLLQTIQAVLSGACQERPGRLTEDAEPLGFGGVAVVGATRAASSPKPEEPPPTLAERDTSVLERALGQARALVAERRRAEELANSVVANARRAHDETVSALQGVVNRIEEVQKSLAALTAKRERLEQEEAERRGACEQAERGRSEAERAFEKAASELARLENEARHDE